MRHLVVAPRAADDLAQLLTTSAERHGTAARQRYERLLALALDELRTHPRGEGTRAAGVGDLRLYPLRRPAQRLPAGCRVRAPPHLIAYRFDEAKLEIVRVLHEAMDVPARLLDREQI